MPTHEELRAQLAELVAIPSVSADPAHAETSMPRRNGSRVHPGRRRQRRGRPLERRPPARHRRGAASERPESAPTVLCYAHFDVQPPDPLELWDSPPFELAERDGWLYARGVADDKAHLFMLVEAARQLAAAGELPVNVRFALDSEEEVGGQSVVEWVAADERGADAAIVFDGDMIRKGRPDLLHRASRALLLPRHGPHRGAGPALGSLRRRGDERDARPHADACRGLTARRPPARAVACRHRAADGRGGRRVAGRSRAAPLRWAPSARQQRIPRR